MIADLLNTLALVVAHPDWLRSVVDYLQVKFL